MVSASVGAATAVVTTSTAAAHIKARAVRQIGKRLQQQERTIGRQFSSIGQTTSYRGKHLKGDNGLCPSKPYGDNKP